MTTTLQTHLANRAAVCEAVRNDMTAALAKIDQGVEDGHFPDGLTEGLGRARQFIGMVIREMPAAEEPEPEGD